MLLGFIASIWLSLFYGGTGGIDVLSLSQKSGSDTQLTFFRSISALGFRILMFALFFSISALVFVFPIANINIKLFITLLTFFNALFLLIAKYYSTERFTDHISHALIKCYVDIVSWKEFLLRTITVFVTCYTFSMIVEEMYGFAHLAVCWTLSMSLLSLLITPLKDSNSQTIAQKGSAYWRGFWFSVFAVLRSVFCSIDRSSFVLYSIDLGLLWDICNSVTYGLLSTYPFLAMFGVVPTVKQGLLYLYESLTRVLFLHPIMTKIRENILKTAVDICIVSVFCFIFKSESFILTLILSVVVVFSITLKVGFMNIWAISLILLGSTCLFVTGYLMASVFNTHWFVALLSACLGYIAYYILPEMRSASPFGVLKKPIFPFVFDRTNNIMAKRSWLKLRVLDVTILIIKVAHIVFTYVFIFMFDWNEVFQHQILAVLILQRLLRSSYVDCHTIPHVQLMFVLLINFDLTFINIESKSAKGLLLYATLVVFFFKVKETVRKSKFVFSHVFLNANHKTIVFFLPFLPVYMMSFIVACVFSLPLSAITCIPLVYIPGSAKGRKFFNDIDPQLDIPEEAPNGEIVAVEYDSVSKSLARSLLFDSFLGRIPFAGDDSVLLMVHDQTMCFVHIWSMNMFDARYQLRGLETSGTICHNYEQARLLDTVNNKNKNIKDTVLYWFSSTARPVTESYLTSAFSRNVVRLSHVVTSSSDSVLSFIQYYTYTVLIMLSRLSEREMHDQIKAIEQHGGEAFERILSRLSTLSLSEQYVLVDVKPQMNIGSFVQRYCSTFSDTMVRRVGWFYYFWLFHNLQGRATGSFVKEVYHIGTGKMRFRKSMAFMKREVDSQHVKTMSNIVERSVHYSIQLLFDELIMLISKETPVAQLRDRLSVIDREYCLTHINSRDFRKGVTAQKNHVQVLMNPHAPIVQRMDKTIIYPTVFIMNTEALKALWEMGLQEIVYFNASHNERASVQSNSVILKNLCISAANTPLGYPVRISKDESSDLRLMFESKKNSFQMRNPLKQNQV
ncbi:hypothetical protein PCE1_000254 [Barthelona sp. PCE]